MKEEKKKKVTGSAIREMWRNSVRIIRLTYRTKSALVLGIGAIYAVAAGINFASSGTNALLINELVGAAGSGAWTSRILIFFVLVIGMRFIPDLIWQLRDYWNWKLWFKMEEDFNVMLLQQKASLDVATHESPDTQNLFTRVNENGVWRMSSFMERAFYMFQYLLEVLIAGFIILTFKWWVFVVVFAGILPDLFVEVKYGRMTYGIDEAEAGVKRQYWNLQGHFRGVNDIVELKLMGLAKGFLERITSLFRSFRGKEEATEWERLKKGSWAGFVSQASLVVALGWAVHQVLFGSMQIGTLTFVFASMLNLRQSLSNLFQSVARQYKDSLYLTDIFNFLDLKPHISKPGQPTVLAPDATPEIVFEHVSFHYPNSETLILKDVNLRINAGEKLALVGINGAGKTTLIKLLCRFYDPSDGRITVGGVDLREIDLESWYVHLGAIFQDYSQYNFMVKEAISVSVPDKDPVMARIKEAAKSAEADIFIEEWDKGYDQMLGKQFDGGVEPSIGQWQKLALARTFYRYPRILILDEPTSSIDAEAEAKIFEKLEQLPEDRTVVLISHRFSTVRHADKIIVIENGTISEQGTHKELLASDKSYARLFKLQAKGYK